jgi:transcriptional/translational regulatory protein YebC/TACO1
MFDKRGLLYLDAERFPEDDVLEAALEAGADDMTTEGDQHVITTDPTLLHSVREALEAKGLSVTEAEIGMIPQNNVMVEGKDAESIIKLTDALEDHDDVSKVFSNFDIDPETLAAVDG